MKRLGVADLETIGGGSIIFLLLGLVLMTDSASTTTTETQPQNVTIPLVIPTIKSTASPITTTTIGVATIVVTSTHAPVPREVAFRIWNFHSELGQTSGRRQEAIGKLVISQLCHAIYQEHTTPHAVNDLNKRRFKPKAHSRHLQQSTALATFLTTCCSKGQNECSSYQVSLFIKCIYSKPNPTFCRSHRQNKHLIGIVILLFLSAIF